jgi:hypothetical protein
MKLEQTYIYKGGKAWFISTINRECSAAAVCGSLYAETMAWEIDPKTNERFEMIKQGEAGRDSLRTHDRIVLEIRNIST